MNPFELPPFLYFVVTAIVLAGWAVLAIFPREPWANLWISGIAVPLVLCLFYMSLLLAFWYLAPQGRFSEFLTLGGVYRMFANSGLLLVGWINILAMDLVVGAWMARKAAQTGMPLYLLYPCLLFTFLFAGIGIILFSIAASIGDRWSRISDVEEVPALESQPVMAVPEAK